VVLLADGLDLLRRRRRLLGTAQDDRDRITGEDEEDEEAQRVGGPEDDDAQAQPSEDEGSGGWNAHQFSPASQVS
jgi:hypothetical protein